MTRITQRGLQRAVGVCWASGGRAGGGRAGGHSIHRRPGQLDAGGRADGGTDAPHPTPRHVTLPRPPPLEVFAHAAQTRALKIKPHAPHHHRATRTYTQAGSQGRGRGHPHLPIPPPLHCPAHTHTHPHTVLAPLTVRHHAFCPHDAHYTPTPFARGHTSAPTLRMQPLHCHAGQLQHLPAFMPAAAVAATMP